MKTILLVLLPLLFLGCESEKKTEKIERILFIGNSYLYENDGVDEHLNNLIQGTKGLNADAQRAAEGRYHLMNHWKDEETQALFSSEKWDKIVLQEWGSGPLKKNAEFEKYVKKWTKKLHSVNAKGKVLLFSTWNYQSAKGMEDRLYEKYSKIAKEVKAEVVPAGLLWKNIRDKVHLYAEDGAHPNRKGTFVSACLFYERIFNRDVTKTKNTDPILSKAEQTKLKKWVHAFNSNWQE